MRGGHGRRLLPPGEQQLEVGGGAGWVGAGVQELGEGEGVAPEAHRALAESHREDCVPRPHEAQPGAKVAPLEPQAVVAGHAAVQAAQLGAEREPATQFAPGRVAAGAPVQHLPPQLCEGGGGHLARVRVVHGRLDAVQCFHQRLAAFVHEGLRLLPQGAASLRRLRAHLPDHPLPGAAHGGDALRYHGVVALGRCGLRRRPRSRSPQRASQVTRGGGSHLMPLALSLPGQVIVAALVGAALLRPPDARLGLPVLARKLGLLLLAQAQAQERAVAGSQEQAAERPARVWGAAVSGGGRRFGQQGNTPSHDGQRAQVRGEALLLLEHGVAAQSGQAAGAHAAQDGGVHQHAPSQLAVEVRPHALHRRLCGAQTGGGSDGGRPRVGLCGRGRLWQPAERVVCAQLVVPRVRVRQAARQLAGGLPAGGVHAQQHHAPCKQPLVEHAPQNGPLLPPQAPLGNALRPVRSQTA